MVKGKLGKFEFQRAWYYYMVKGLVPLAVAEELYADKIGRTDIRVTGHCGCPPPKDWTTRYNPSTDIRMITKKSAEEYPNIVKDLGWEVNDEGGEQYVDNYHIDSELGLCLFVKTIKKHKLA